MNKIYDTFKVYSHTFQNLFKCWFTLIILIVVITFICFIFIGVIFLLMVMFFHATHLSYSTIEENGVSYFGISKLLIDADFVIELFDTAEVTKFCLRNYFAAFLNSFTVFSFHSNSKFVIWKVCSTQYV